MEGYSKLPKNLYDALKREVYEETGLTVESATLIAVFSDPKYSGVTAYGDEYQSLAFLFGVDSWSGTLLKTTDETTDADFFPEEALPTDPPVPLHHRESLECSKAYCGMVILK